MMALWLPLGAAMLSAQPAYYSSIATPGSATRPSPGGAPKSGDTTSGSSFRPKTGDVLTPNNRRNRPNLKIGIRAGINRTSYTNDRYLNNVPLDVGDVSGETDIYTSAAGFGYQFGGDFEYPLNQALSLLFTAQYDHISFGGGGSVQEPCVHSDGTQSLGTSIHDWRANINYLKIAASAKLTFSSWYITAGLTGEHPLSTSLTRTRRLGGQDCFYPGSGTPLKRAIEESGDVPSPSGLHYSIRLGGGIVYQLNDHFQFSPELTLDYGFNRINKSPNSDIGVYGISAIIRYDLR
ncbi:MAG: hypothetical protein JWQ98_3242 [Chlorobi bacterium]|nr:hypothetical protein [Chlorobiota bacterium]